MRNLAISTLTLIALLFVTPSCSETNAGANPLEAITKHMTSIGDSVAKVKDEASAKTANTTISGIVDKISGLMKGAKALPGDGMKKITDMLGKEKGGLVAKIQALAGPLKTILAPALKKLQALGS